MGLFSGLLEGVTRANTTKQAAKELERFARFAGRPTATAEAGTLYTVDAHAGYRLVKVVEVEGDIVHIALSRAAPVSVRETCPGSSMARVCWPTR
jgi:hypothetical protein